MRKRLFVTIMVLLSFLINTYVAALDLSSIKYDNASLDREWSKTKIARFEEKLISASQSGCIDTGLFKIDEINQILKYVNLDATAICAQHIVADIRDAIAPPLTTIYRGMKNIDESIALSIFENGYVAPTLYRYRSALEAQNRDEVDNLVLSPISTDIKTHTQFPSDGIYLSNSQTIETAHKFAGPEGFIFQIVLKRNQGIEVEKVLGPKYGYDHEKEIVIPFQLPGSFVICAKNKVTGRIYHNPKRVTGTNIPECNL